MTRAKRISALILTVIMMISIIPVAAMAAGINGWKKENGKWYYYKDGVKVKDGWIKDGGKWYYLYYDGEMAADIFVPESSTSFYKYYYVDKSGAMVTKAGWRKIGLSHSSSSGYWIYIKKGGVLALEWQKVSGKWYYFIPIMIDGDMAPNGFFNSDRYYFFNKDGSMKVNCWVQNSKGKWYYVGKDGSSQTGWKKSSSKWYYLDPEESGEMVTSKTLKIKDKWYTFDEDGICTNPEGSTVDPNKGKPIELPFVPADVL